MIICLYTDIKFQAYVSNCETFLFDPQMGPKLVIALMARVDLEEMAIKRYSRTPELEPHYWMQSSLIPSAPFWLGRRFIPLLRIQLIYSKPYQ